MDAADRLVLPMDDFYRQELREMVIAATNRARQDPEQARATLERELGEFFPISMASSLTSIVLQTIR